jgi:hypothetical protein
MDFNSEVKSIFSQLLQSFDLHLVYEVKNLLEFESANISVRFVYNERENSNYFFVGKKDKMLYPINEYMKDLKNALIQKSEDKNQPILSKFYSFLNSEIGVEILNGDISQLEHFIRKDSLEYTSMLGKHQRMQKADDAWLKKDYVKYVNLVEEIGLSNISNLYRLRYKFAKKKSTFNR